MIKTHNILIAFYGIITVAVFIQMTIAGGLFNSVHTLFFREISFLISPYSLYQDATVPLYRIYNVNLLIFAVILLFRFKNKFAKLGALYLAMSAVMSLLLVEIPMDAVMLSRSLGGFSHIIVALLTSLFLLIAMQLFSYGFRFNKHLRFISRYSFIVSCIILGAGFTTGIFALLNLPEYVGLIQKLPIAAFLIWIAMTAVVMLRSDKRVRYAGEGARKNVAKNRRARS